MSLSHTHAVVAASLCLAITCGLAVADIINVPGDFPTIQLAIDAAVNGDEILVAPGTYVENLDYSGKTIIIRSTGGADATTIQPLSPGAGPAFAFPVAVAGSTTFKRGIETSVLRLEPLPSAATCRTTVGCRRR